MSKKNIPELRFPGFEDDWKRRKFGDEMYIKSRVGWQALTKKEYLDQGDYYLITGTDIDEITHTVDLTKSWYVSKERYEMDENIQVHNGDLIITKDGTIGKVAFIKDLDKPATLNSHLFLVRDLSGYLDSGFFFQILNSWVFQSFIERVKTGSTLTGLPQKTIVEFEFSYPSLEEQRQISNFLEAVDQTIIFHQRKLDEFKKLKSGLLQKMFPQKGEKVPQIRFPGFTGDWEQCKLGEAGSFYYGRSCPKWSVTEDATTPCIRYGELYTKFGAKVDKVYSHTNIDPENLRFSNGTEVLIPRVGEDPMDYNHCTWLSLPNIAIGEMISVYNTDNDPFFTATMFNATLQKEFARRVEGGSVTNLYFETLKDIPVSFPSLEEQKKISEFVMQLDQIITLHQKKIDDLNQLKSGLLQKMFV